jgi:uncharacterized protein (DUF1697 family)
MTTYLALLRAINLGGHQQVAMADLRSTGRNWNTVLKLGALANG